MKHEVKYDVLCLKNKSQFLLCFSLNPSSMLICSVLGEEHDVDNFQLSTNSSIFSVNILSDIVKSSKSSLFIVPKTPAVLPKNHPLNSIEQTSNSKLHVTVKPLREETTTTLSSRVSRKSP